MFLLKQILNVPQPVNIVDEAFNESEHERNQRLLQIFSKILITIYILASLDYLVIIYFVNEPLFIRGILLNLVSISFYLGAYHYSYSTPFSSWLIIIGFIISVGYEYWLFGTEVPLVIAFILLITFAINFMSARIVFIITTFSLILNLAAYLGQHSFRVYSPPLSLSGLVYSLVNIALLCFGVPAIALMLFIPARNRIESMQRQNRDLQQINSLLQTALSELATKSHEVTQASEQTRLNIARDIHDYPVQLLVPILSMFTNNDPPTSTREMLCWKIAQDMDKHLRAICLNIRPIDLEEVGLENALESLAAEFVRVADVSFNMDIEIGLTQIDIKAEKALYRVAQEALNNIAKHAQANEVFLSLRADDGWLILSVRDNGIGFNPPVSLKDFLLTGHMGLLFMTEHMAQIGTVAIKSQLEEGTEIKAEIKI